MYSLIKNFLQSIDENDEFPVRASRNICRDDKIWNESPAARLPPLPHLPFPPDRAEIRRRY